MGQRILRITQSTETSRDYRVELAIEGGGLPRQTATVEFAFHLEPQHQEDLRQYLEDYLQYPQDPAPTVAARIERDIQTIGSDLFRKVFHANEDSRDLWATVRHHLQDTRVEISTSVTGATSIPWELIRDPKTDTPLALRAAAFVRTFPQAAQFPALPQADSDLIRILLVICRPGRDADVPFRSVAAQLIRALGDQSANGFRLDVLRPATFGSLSRVLHEAKATARPYHVVHFDGHGIYAEIANTATTVTWLHKAIPFVFSGPRTGSHGFLLFENPDHESNIELVDGPSIANLLVTTNVPLLVLNACRSAHAEAPGEPQRTADDVHHRVRSFGSLAQEIMDAGVAGVVAMRYNVYVVTAAQFVADLYASLVQGRSLGESVSMGRKQLWAMPNRSISFNSRPLQDWCVPVVYEAAPIQLFSVTRFSSDYMEITVKTAESDAARGVLDTQLPRPPDVGFFGRDETLLALDRVFDVQSIVLLHAFAGSGKTSTAAEFARWYALTGGVDGPVLFTSFETYTPLSRVLDRIGDAFGSVLEQKGIQWLTLDDEARQDVAIQVLGQTGVLWIWDNVESITGDAYTAGDRQDLANFLREAADTRVKILLTGRSTVEAWLGNLPTRITVPPMPMQECLQLARALAERHGSQLTHVYDWRPILRFANGNPLTIGILVSQVLHHGLRTRDEITQFIADLRKGEDVFDAEHSHGHARSLATSLTYGLEHTFGPSERQQLAVLSLFQTGVGTGLLWLMGHEDIPWSLEEVRGLSEDYWGSLLDRAADVGFLERACPGSYAIHPVLPWFFRRSLPQTPDAVSRFEKAFAGAMDYAGMWVAARYGSLDRDPILIEVLIANEDNFLAALSIAERHSLHGECGGIIRALTTLYSHTGRLLEWHRFLTRVDAYVSDPKTGNAIPGREDCWYVITDHRAFLAAQLRQFAEAEGLAVHLVEKNREKVASFAELPISELSPIQRSQLAELAHSLTRLGTYQLYMGNVRCLTALKESFSIATLVDSQEGIAFAAYNLGLAYQEVAGVQDFNEAESWYNKCLGLQHMNTHESAKIYHQLASLAFERFKACMRNTDRGECFRFLNQGLESLRQAFSLVPETATEDRARLHNMAGLLNGNARRIPQAREHYVKSINLSEIQGQHFWAGKSREFFSIDLARNGDFQEALLWAKAAIVSFRRSTPFPEPEIKKVEGMIEDLQEVLARRGSETDQVDSRKNHIETIAGITMTHAEFQDFIFAEPQLANAIRAAANTSSKKQFGVLTEGAIIALMFPVARFLLVRIGLPWLFELGRYSELQRRRVHEWIDNCYDGEGFDPEQAEAASDALIEQLEGVTDCSARKAWQQLADHFGSAE